MKFLFLPVFVLAVLTATAQVDTIQIITPGRENSMEQQQKPYVILISLDGFRWDYAEKYNAENIKMLGASGVRAESMIPSYPSLTFPNHYTLATGLYPSHHGLVSNSFYDRNRKESYVMSDKLAVRDGSWYGGTPIWVLAEQQQMLSASFYWVGSEANIKNKVPSYYYNYSEAIPNTRRVEIIKNWLALPPAKRPHLITVYFSEPDHNGHTYGPESPETAQAVKMVDSAVGQLVAAIKTTGLPVNFILVSDHGMTTIDVKKPLKLPTSIDSSKFTVIKSGQLVMLYAKNKEDIKPVYKELKKDQVNFKTYLKRKMPSNLHYSTKDDIYGRIGDILLIPDWNKAFAFGSREMLPGAHGYNPYKVKDMHAIFYAWGPVFKKNLVIPSFENVNVYPIVADILGLRITEKIDGTRKVGMLISNNYFTKNGENLQ